MRLKTLVTVNWGTLKNGPVDFTLATLLTGESGAGKSMLLDATQTVLTACYQNVYKFNVAQSESADKRSRKKIYRTLEGYALGQLGQDFQRPNAHAWVAAVFEADGVEMCEPFTALVGITAVREGKTSALLQKQAFYLVRGEVSIDHLTQAMAGGGRSALPLSEARDVLEAAFPKHVTPFRDEKGEYLQALYGWFESRPHVSLNEALASARALVKASAYRPVDSIHDLIRNDILDEVDMSGTTDDISSILRQIRGLSEESKRLGNSLLHLKKVEEKTAEARKQYVNVTAIDLAQAEFRVASTTKAIVSATTERDNHIQEFMTLKAKLAASDAQADGLSAQLRAVESRLEEHPAAGQEDKLNGAIAEATGTLQKNGPLLKGQLGLLSGLYAGRAKFLAALDTEPHVTESLKRIELAAAKIQPELLSRMATDLDQRLQSDADLSDLNTGILKLQATGEALVRAFADETSDDSLISALVGAQALLGNEGREARESLTAIRNRVAVLASGRIYLPDGIREALELIRRELPGANPTILAEHVEPKLDSPWIGLVERVIGADRYMILVDPRFEEAAMKLLPSVRSEGLRPSIPQIRRLMAEVRGTRPDDESILSELNVKNPIARAFLLARYNGVLKVADLATLRDTSRGVTLEGHQCGGYAVWHIEPMSEGELMFGTAGRALSLERATQERARLEGRVEAIKARADHIRALLPVVRGIAALNVAQLLQELIEAQAKRTFAQNALGFLDLSDTRELRAKESSLRGQIHEAKEARSALDQELGKQENKKSQAQDKIDRAESALPERAVALAKARDSLSALSTLDASIDTDALIAEAQAIASASASIDSLSGRRPALESAFRNAVLDLRTTLIEYNRNARPVEAIQQDLPANLGPLDLSSAYAPLLLIASQTHHQLLAQGSHALASVADQLTDTEAQFNSAFTSLFAASICNHIAGGLKTINDLNKRIVGQVFGRDSYKVEWTWVPEYKAYADFFNTVKDRSGELTHGRTIFDLEMSPELMAVGTQIKALLLSADAASAEKRLADITDWRNYRNYDVTVYRKDQPTPMSFSEVMTGSGGETQTPFYVIRGSVLSSALRHGNNSSTHLSMVFLDEAFSAMDGKRSKKAMELLQSTFGFQVICAMPTKNSGPVKPLFDLEYQFDMVDAGAPGSGQRVTINTPVKLRRAANEALFGRSHAQIASEVRARLGLLAPLEAAAPEST